MHFGHVGDPSTCQPFALGDVATRTQKNPSQVTSSWFVLTILPEATGHLPRLQASFEEQMVTYVLPFFNSVEDRQLELFKNYT